MYQCLHSFSFNIFYILIKEFYAKIIFQIDKMLMLTAILFFLFFFFLIIFTYFYFFVDIDSTFILRNFILRNFKSSGDLKNVEYSLIVFTRTLWSGVVVIIMDLVYELNRCFTIIRVWYDPVPKKKKTFKKKCKREYTMNGIVLLLRIK